jgi:hypothetical protein
VRDFFGATVSAPVFVCLFVIVSVDMPITNYRLRRYKERACPGVCATGAGLPATSSEAPNLCRKMKIELP